MRGILPGSGARWQSCISRPSRFSLCVLLRGQAWSQGNTEKKLFVTAVLPRQHVLLNRQEDVASQDIQVTQVIQSAHLLVNEKQFPLRATWAGDLVALWPLY